jgi:hypothetical protein
MEDRRAPGPESLESWSNPACPADDAGKILLTKTARPSDWWVVAPGYAWARVRVAADDVARRVALAPGGGLRVEIEGTRAGVEAMVDATPAENEGTRVGQALLILDADTGRHSMGGLASGRWVVRVGRGGELWVQEPWASVVAEVVAGRTTDVRLVVPPPAPKAGHTVEFELVVPAGWKERPTSISVTGCADVTKEIQHSIAVPEDVSLPWRVGVEGLEYGPYEVRVEPYGWSSLVRIRREPTVIRLEVPAPVAVRVRVLDAKDGKPLSGARVLVSAVKPWESSHGGGPVPEDSTVPVADEDAMPTSWSGGHQVLQEGPDAGSYVGQFCAGAGTISADVTGYVSRRQRVSIPASPTVFEHVLQFSRGGTIEARIVRAGKTFEAAEGMLFVWPDHELEEDEGVIKGADACGGKASFDGLPPDTYDVMWYGAPFRDLRETKKVTVRTGETVKVEFEAPAPPPK